MNMPPRVLILLALLPTVAAAQQVAPAAIPVANSRAGAKVIVDRLASVGRFPIAGFIRWDVIDGHLTAELLADVPVRPVRSRIELDGIGGTWVITRRAAGAGPAAQVTVTRYDFDAAADEPWLSTVTFGGNALSVYGQFGENVGGFRVRLSRAVAAAAGGNDRRVTLSVTSVNPGYQSALFSGSAASFRQLQADHPAEVRRYLAPLLRNLSGRLLLRPGAADVYRAFPSIAADAGVAHLLEDAIVKMEDDDFSVREGGSKGLEALEEPGVLAAVRRGRADLLPETGFRIDEFLARYANATAAEVAAVDRTDPGFLIDCLDDADSAVRGLAKAELAHVLGRVISFDVDVDPADRPAAVERLRKALGSATRPANRPG